MKRVPGRFHPGEYIREEMRTRGWTIVEMCTYRMSILEDQFDPKVLGAILKGRHSIDIGIAKRLEIAFGIEAKFWLNLQGAYDESENK